VHVDTSINSNSSPGQINMFTRKEQISIVALLSKKVGNPWPNILNAAKYEVRHSEYEHYCITIKVIWSRQKTS
jgi:hypothetical protein